MFKKEMVLIKKLVLYTILFRNRALLKESSGILSKLHNKSFFNYNKMIKK